MPYPRHAQVSTETTPYYHCVSRCVRRAFLCGWDRLTGQSYEHRKQWVVDRLALLGDVFCIDVCAYAIMADHHHVVLRLNPEQAAHLSEDEVLERWCRLFGLPLLVERYRQDLGEYLDTHYPLYVTAERIAQNQRTAELNKLHSILPPSAYDNDLVADAIQVTAPEALGSDEPLPVYRAYKNGEPVAAILTVVAPNGYNGPIKLLVGIRTNGKIAGVRILHHNETPGLGDGIETARSDWITQFRDKSLDQPDSDAWATQPHGGEFDALSGATVTSDAVAGAVKRALEYFGREQKKLFQAASGKN